MPRDPAIASDLLKKLDELKSDIQDLADQSPEGEEDMPSMHMAPESEIMRPDDMGEEDMEPTEDAPSEGAEMGADLANVNPATHNARAKAEAEAQRIGKKNHISRGWGAAVEKAVG